MQQEKSSKNEQQRLPRIPIKLRELKETDKEFVYNSFLRSYRKSPMNQYMSTTNYYKTYKEIICGEVDKNVVIIACNPDLDDQIYGYLVHNSGGIIYVYTKFNFRFMGVCDELINKGFKWDGESIILIKYITHKFHKIRDKYNLEQGASNGIYQ